MYSFINIMKFVTFKRNKTLYVGKLSKTEPHGNKSKIEIRGGGGLNTKNFNFHYHLSDTFLALS